MSLNMRDGKWQHPPLPSPPPNYPLGPLNYPPAAPKPHPSPPLHISDPKRLLGCFADNTSLLLCRLGEEQRLVSVCVEMPRGDLPVRRAHTHTHTWAKKHTYTHCGQTINRLKVCGRRTQTARRCISDEEQTQQPECNTA